MKASEFIIRDPFILLHEDTYYLYGSRSETVWSDQADGFDCYKSTDLENWEGPIEIFHRSQGFWADRCYWAPECMEHHNAFYLITTLASKDRKKGIYILKSDHPEGPFQPYSERLTPQDWTCIDGTVYQDGEKMYLVYSHSFEDSPSGDMCCQELSPDLRNTVSEPRLLFQAAQARWAKPVPFAKAEFGMDGDVYFTDGPFLFQKDGTLYMTWSSWGTSGYAVGLAYSDTGHVDGTWHQIDQPFFPENGGHGMAFLDKNGKLWFTLHFPNDKYQEHVTFIELDLPDRV